MMRLHPLLSLFGRLAAPFLVPAKTASAAARSRGQGRPSGRRVLRASLDGGEPGRKLGNYGTSARTPRARRATACLMAFLLGAGATVGANGQAAVGAHSAPSVAEAVEEASARFGVPKAWIEAVIAAESGGDPAAVSPRGAIGLMQLMPATWRELTAQLDLGGNAFDRRANILAGTAYLRRLYDRFGPGGFLAAYNAGPTRYQALLDGGRKLPAETLTYVAAVEARIARSGGAAASINRTRPQDWRASGLFVSRRPEMRDDRAGATMITLVESIDPDVQP
ncbi:lytic transglycosylase domain-containing protein [Caulobacter endophyticus]|uniref:Murein transglycosylase n=1 Tax=Caulobacter endophyticus TaxID=2172652 RepID=A0A2T9JEH4_9CAUL|nr:lytic transglycosylase domain-containing protein [Caulobacter endophyticus]PVM82094.1 murein transglycosylase [Caulobacter endophyticus]